MPFQKNWYAILAWLKSSRLARQKSSQVSLSEIIKSQAGLQEDTRENTNPEKSYTSGRPFITEKHSKIKTAKCRFGGRKIFGDQFWGHGRICHDLKYRKSIGRQTKNDVLQSVMWKSSVVKRRIMLKWKSEWRYFVLILARYMICEQISADQLWGCGKFFHDLKSENQVYILHFWFFLLPTVRDTEQKKQVCNLHICLWSSRRLAPLP